MDKTIFWVGTEINKGAPTQLPSMKDIVYYMVDMLSGEPGTNILRDRVAEYNSFMRKIIYNAGDLLNPTMLVPHWSQIQGTDVFQGLACLQDAPFNTNHCILAYCLSKGSCIVTTNIDLCIEKAYQALTQESMRLVSRENGVYIYEGRQKNSGKIYHLHGICENTKEIGGIYPISKGTFGKEFRSEIKKWMTQEYELYFLGDEGVESFDVNFFIHYMKDHLTQVNCRVMLISARYRRRRYTRLFGIINCFRKCSLIDQNVGEYLRAWYLEKLGLIKQDCGFGRLVKEQNNTPVDWQEAVRTSLYQSRLYWDILLLHVNQATGVPVATLDPNIYQRLEKLPLSCRSMYMSLMLRCQYDLVPPYGYHTEVDPQWSEDEYGIGINLIHLCRSSYNQCNQEVRQYAQTVEQLETNYFLALRRKNSTRQYEGLASELEQKVDALLRERERGGRPDLPVRNFKENADLYRIRAVLRSMLCAYTESIKWIEYDLVRSYFYCCQNGNRRGVVKTLKNAISCNMFFYYKFGKKSFYDKAQKYKTLCKKQSDSGWESGIGSR